MGQPHKHAEIIKAWADGEKIQHYDNGKWYDIPSPLWDQSTVYRIKPEPKPDVVWYAAIDSALEEELGFYATRRYDKGIDSLKLTFDGQTGKLKSAEVLK